MGTPAAACGKWSFKMTQDSSWWKELLQPTARRGLGTSDSPETAGL